MDERVEGGVDQRSVLRTGVRLRRLAGGLGDRFGVQVSQMLGADGQRSGAYSTYVQGAAQAATAQMARRATKIRRASPAGLRPSGGEEMVQDAVELLGTIGLRSVAGAFQHSQP